MANTSEPGSEPFKQMIRLQQLFSDTRLRITDLDPSNARSLSAGKGSRVDPEYQNSTWPLVSPKLLRSYEGHNELPRLRRTIWRLQP